MDQLTVTFAPAEGVGYNEPTLGLYASAVVNGQELPEVLDIDVFFEALAGTGVLPLFTCTCGVFGCGGYYIGVARTAEAWIWRNRYAPDDAPNPAHVLRSRRTARRLAGGTLGSDGLVGKAPHTATGEAWRRAHGGVDRHRLARPPRP